MQTFVSGFSLGISLILAIGAQNAFVLKQGLKKQHVFMVCSICALSDSILISIGVSGFGVLIKEYPSVEQISRYAGAAFLLGYALKSFYSAIRVEHHLDSAADASQSAMKIAMICLAFTWLNPHVYLDTVVLLGSISTQFPGSTTEFALGAISSSFVFFFTLGYGARVLIPIFKKDAAWKILDGFVGLLMLSLALSLVFEF